MLYTNSYYCRPKFRSYKPQDEQLKENVVEEPKPGDVEGEVQDLLAAGKSKVIIEELVSNVVLLFYTWCLSN